jgi:hypothetical protein
MVTYQKWTQVLFEVARESGIDTGSRQTQIVSLAAEAWNNNKSDMSAATVSEAREAARRLLR